jgi:DNA-binding transcriptional regulator YiaG
MTGHRPFSELRKRMTPQRRARNAEATERMLASMALYELRQARERSQEELARVLKVGQPAVAKLERRAGTCMSAICDATSKRWADRWRSQAAFPMER